MSKDVDINAKLQYFETQAENLDTMAGQERARLRKEMLEFYDSLDSSKRVLKYAGLGAAAAGILPGIGWIAGGLIGAAVGACTEGEVATNARDQMKKLIDRVG